MSVCCYEWEEAWHLAVGPLGRKTLLDVCLEAEARTVVCALVEGLCVWGERAMPHPLHYNCKVGFALQLGKIPKIVVSVGEWW
jgi:hypothetical protein